MPGSGTDKTKRWIETPAPVVILVEPQLGDNIGAAARAMANFGLSRLRLIKPRDSWPNPRAWVAASGADRVLDNAELFDTVEAAIADLTFVLATTARAHDQAKPVVSPQEAAQLMAPKVAAGETVGIVFGRERYGLESHEVSLADRIVTLPVNPAFASLNLAQAVLIVGYEWRKFTSDGELPFAMPQKSAPATREQLHAFFGNLERELERVEYFRPADKRDTMLINLRNIFHRMGVTRQDIQTLQGAIMAIAEGRKGPARGGVLDGAEAEMSPTTRRRAALRGCSGVTQPTRSACCGTRSQRTAALPDVASSGRRRSDATSPIWCRSRCASWSTSRRRRKPWQRRRIARSVARG